MNLKATRYLLMFFAVLLANINIYAQCDSTNATIDSKVRFLGGWLPNGQPTYLLPPDTISQDIKDAVNNALPEKVNITGTTLFNSDVQPNTELLDTTEIYLTFVHEGAKWFNTLGFYTYDIANPPSTLEDIDSLVIVFPNVDSVDALKPGDKVKLGTFLPNTGIGYFLMAQSWNGDSICMGTHIVFTDKRLNTFTSKAYQQHTVLLHYEQENKLFLGVEDQQRPSGDKDFNDAVFYITAKDFHAIDTTDIPKIPVAEISGDTVLCSDDAVAEITIEISGTPPFDVVYNDGSQNILIEDINSNTYVFETSVRDTLTLVSVKNGVGYGVVKGSAIVQQSQINAYFLTQQIDVCEGTQETVAEVTLEGFPPYSLTYKVDDTEVVLSNISENTVELPISVGSTYALAEVKDMYCQTELDEPLEIIVNEFPEASLETVDTTVCAGSEVDLRFNLTGTAPFTLTYELNGVEKSVSTSDPEFVLTVQENSVVVPVKIVDAHCESTEVFGRATVNFHAIPTFDLSSAVQGCSEAEETVVTLSFAGEAPFHYSYEIDGNIQEFSTSEDFAEVTVGPNELFELISFSDAYCEGVIDEEEAVFEYHAPPSVNFTGDDILCEGGEATLSLEFSGTPPFSFTLKNGSLETNYTVNEEELTVAVSEPGTYEIVNFADANCQGDVDETVVLVLAENPTASISLNGTGEICGDEKAEVVVELEGTAPFTFTYTDGKEDFTVTTDETEYTFETSASGIYRITSLSDAYCSGSASGEIEIKNLVDELFGEISGEDLVCEETGDILLDFTGGGSITSYQWNTTGTGTLNAVSLHKAVYTPAEDETGVVTFSLEIANECATKVLEKEVEIVPTPVATFTIIPEELLADTEITFTAENDGYDNYIWDFGDGNTGTGNPATHFYDEPGEYEITLTVDYKGCMAEGSGEGVVKTKNDLYVPNVFNPNALNTENQVVKVYGTNVSEDGFSFKIVNRWGHIMYQTNSFFTANSQGWDGKEHNSGEMQSLSAFTYIVKGQFKDGEFFEKTGTITILQ